MKNSAIVAVILAFALLCTTAEAIGLGVAPASFVVEDALKGGTYERMLTVYNTGNESGEFTFAAEGAGNGWISFYDVNNPDKVITTVTIPRNDRVKVLVRFEIPDDLANGDYSTTIYAMSVPETEASEGAVAHAVIRIPSKVVIQVTGTQILKGTVENIKVTDTEIGHPLKIQVEFRNEGNVIAKPEIAVAITKNGEPVDRFVHSETGVKPGKKDTITVLWNTSDRQPCDYVAEVSVSLGEALLATQNLPFKVLPFGSLTRQGVLQSISIEGEPLVNRMLKVVADFDNTGEIDTMAKFKGELQRDGSLLDVLESEEMFIEVGESGKLTAYYKLTESGSYAINGRILYAGKTTDPKEVSFDVPDVGPNTQGSKVPGFGAVLTMIAVGSLFLLRKVIILKRR